MMLRSWGDRHLFGPGAEPMTYIHTECGQHVSPSVICGHCHTEVTGANVERIRSADRATTPET